MTCSAASVYGLYRLKGNSGLDYVSKKWLLFPQAWSSHGFYEVCGGGISPPENGFAPLSLQQSTLILISCILAPTYALLYSSKHWFAPSENFSLKKSWAVVVWRNDSVECWEKQNRFLDTLYCCFLLDCYFVSLHEQDSWLHTHVYNT